jgi:hypothetical protein
MRKSRPQDYVHRIGRTGRGGKTGLAHTFFTQADKAHSGELVNVLREAGAPVPEDLVNKFGCTVKKREHACVDRLDAAQLSPPLSYHAQILSYHAHTSSLPPAAVSVRELADSPLLPRPSFHLLHTPSPFTDGAHFNKAAGDKPMPAATKMTFEDE